jgi:hypothetical protein
MKKIFIRTGLLLAIPLLFATCSKFDWDLFDKHHGKGDCQVASFSLSNPPRSDIPWLFKKKFNAAGRVSEIECSFNNIANSADLIHYKLRIAYHGDRVYLINKEIPYDTVTKLFLNSEGRVTKATGNIPYINNNRYYYSGNKLHVVEGDIAVGSTLRRNCEYDNRGNILSISSLDPYSNERVGYFYEYDYSKEAKQQFYMDEVRNIDNTFTLLHYLGFFPELNPVNVRTHVRNGRENHYFVYDEYLLNHQFDANGRLMQYDIVNYDGGQLRLKETASLSWKCK